MKRLFIFLNPPHRHHRRRQADNPPPDEAIRHLQPIGISFSTAFIDYGRFFAKNNYVRFLCIFAQK